jgi:hypothetical protein
MARHNQGLRIARLWSGKPRVSMPEINAHHDRVDNLNVSSDYRKVGAQPEGKSLL